MTVRYLQLWAFLIFFVFCSVKKLFWYFNQFCELLVTTNLSKIALNYKVDVLSDYIKPTL